MRFAKKIILFISAIAFCPNPIKADDGCRVFTDNDKTYYVHTIDNHNINVGAVKSELQSIASDGNIIYIADNLRQSGDNENGIYRIHRFNAIDFSAMDDIVFSVSSLNSELNQQFQLLQIDDNNIYVLFDPKKNSSSTDKKKIFRLYILSINKETGETAALCNKQYKNFDANWSKAGHATVKGNISEGNFDIWLPVYYVESVIARKFEFQSNVCISNTGMNTFSCPGAYERGTISFFNGIGAEAKDGEFFVMDIDSAYPVIRKTDELIEGETVFDENNNTAISGLGIDMSGNGVYFTEYNGNKYAIVSKSITNSNGPIVEIFKYNPAKNSTLVIDPDNAPKFTSLQPTGITMPQTGSDFTRFFYGTSLVAFSKYDNVNHGDGIVNMHVYVPGRSLQTFQLSTSNQTTAINAIPTDDDTIRIYVTDKEICLAEKASSVTVYTLSGACAASASDTDRLDISRLGGGCYIVVADGKAVKFIK